MNRRSRIDWMHHSRPGLRGESEETQTGGGDLRLDEDRRIDAQDTPPRPIQEVDWVFTFTAAAYNLVRMRNLVAAT